MRVPLFDMRTELAPLRADLDAAIARVLDSGTFIGGPEVETFERELAAAAGVAHAVGTSSGTDALLALMMALGVGPGDELVTTPLTFFATAGAPARVGARVVFADVDDATLCLDPARALAACGARTKAIVTVHLYGHPAVVPAAPCPVIEDAAHTLTELPLRGLAAAYSMFPTKNLGALGDAGAVVTADPSLAERVRLLRTHGARPKYHHVAVGGNFRLDALQAAVLRTKLPHVPAWTAARRAHAATYRALLAQAKLPPELRPPTEDAAHAYHQFCIRAPRRDALRAHLQAAGIGTEIYYPEPLHLAPCFADLGYRAGSLPIAERACTELLALPIHPALAPGAEQYVVDQIAAFYAR
ncbi:MAG TPA: DegT/DnrJ/EryC1/StrS family aminotransferase [Kofleriaceae bacterium]|nr:DegT/DnrJ/EryC1/StrS family aminotransferase [Kofleriaceae bacterium]